MVMMHLGVKMRASKEGKLGSAGSHPDVAWFLAPKRAAFPANTETVSLPTGLSANGSAAASLGVHGSPSDAGFAKSHVMTNFSNT